MLSLVIAVDVGVLGAAADGVRDGDRHAEAAEMAGAGRSRPATGHGQPDETLILPRDDSCLPVGS